ncbi:MAG: hypothetical protein Q9218_004084 [Villophora microphyllina]
MSLEKALPPVPEMIHTPQRPKAKQRDDQQMPWTEQVARGRAKAPVRRLSAGEERRSLRNVSPVQQEELGDEWKKKLQSIGQGHTPMRFGLPTSITQQVGLLEDGRPDRDRDEGYVPWSAAAPSFREEDNDNELLEEDELTNFPALEYYKYPIPHDDVFSPFSGFTNEQGTTEQSNTERATWSLKDELINAFALHALNELVGGGFRNEFANFGPKRVKLTQRPRTEIHGHSASLWLKNYGYDNFLKCVKSLSLHEQQTLGYSRTGCGPRDRPKFKAFIDIKRENNRVETVLIDDNDRASRLKYEKTVLPAIQGSGAQKPRIRVRTRRLECDVDCDCYNPGELIFTAPDYGSSRVDVSWHHWKNDGKALTNSQVFEESFLDPMFPYAMYANQRRFNIQLPDGPILRVARSVDSDLYPTLTREVQRALSDLAARVTKENLKEKEVKVWMIKEPPLGTTFELPSESSSQKSPGLARAEGSFFVYRPARTTHFRYDSPYTLKRFFAQARAQLYPDTPANALQLVISPSEAARQEGKLLPPIAEKKEGYDEPDDSGKTAEDHWKSEYLDVWFNVEEDIWAMKIFDRIKVSDGTSVTKEAKYWDTRTSNTGSQAFSSEVLLRGSSYKLFDGLAEISRDLLNIDPRVSDLGIVLHVKRSDPATQTKEWLKWSKEHSFNHFLLEVFYKIDKSDIVIYPGDYTETEKPPPLDETPTIVDTAQNMARMKAKAVRQEIIKPWTPPPPKERPRGPFDPMSTATWDHLAFNPQADTTSQTQMGLLKHQVNRLQAQIERREEACRVCGLSILTDTPGKDLLQEHYETHRAAQPRNCPHEGCEEDLDDRKRYPSFTMVFNHISTHDKIKRCKHLDCHCLLYLLTPAQLEAHYQLHPLESMTRQPYSNPALAAIPTQDLSRTTQHARATQTESESSWQEPPQSRDNMDDRPDPSRNILRCPRCFRDLDRMSPEASEMTCGTKVEKFERFNDRVRTWVYADGILPMSAAAINIFGKPPPAAKQATNSAEGTQDGTASVTTGVEGRTRSSNAAKRGHRKAAMEKTLNEDREVADDLLGHTSISNAVVEDDMIPPTNTTDAAAPALTGSSIVPPVSPTKASSGKRKAASMEETSLPSSAATTDTEAQESDQQPPVKKTRSTKAATAEAAQPPITTAPTTAPTALENQKPFQEYLVKKVGGRKRKADEGEPTTGETEIQQPKAPARVTKKAKVTLTTTTSQPVTDTGNTRTTTPEEPTSQQSPKLKLKLNGPKSSPTQQAPLPGNDAAPSLPPYPPPPPPQTKPPRKPRTKKATTTAPSTTEQAAPPPPKPPRAPRTKKPKVEPADAPAPEGILSGKDEAERSAPPPLKGSRKPRTGKPKTRADDGAPAAADTPGVAGQQLGEEIGGAEGNGEAEGVARQESVVEEEEGRSKRKRKETVKMAESKRQKKG